MTDPVSTHVTRRGFVRTTAGLAGILAAGRAPASWAAREVSLLTAVNYAPTSDAKLTELGKRYTKLTGVNVRIDHIQSVQMSAKLASELMSKAGHDIISLEMHYPWLFAPGLADVSDICNDLSKKHGEWYPFAKEHAQVKGQWLGVPYLYISFPGSHRIDLFEKVGEKAPDTWDDLLRAGRKLKKLGHPVGFAISQTTDSVSTLYSILWCYGAKDVAEDGKTISINSKQTEAVIDYVQALYSDAMDPAVLSWDNAGNNQWLNSGKGSWIHNPISPYNAALKEKMPIADDINHHNSPAGPAGAHSAPPILGLGIWKFSKNLDLAKEFIQFLFRKENFDAWIVASNAFNHPPLRHFADHPIWARNPKFAMLPKEAEYGHPRGWPAKPNDAVGRIDANYIMPDMVAKAVNGMPTKRAMEWAQDQVARAIKGQLKVG
jgi:multiple sugar transport system substrate-binding protein